MPVQHLIDTYKAFGFGDPTGLGLTGESAGLMPQRRYWASWIARLSLSATA
ncbi:Peptidoglycan synthase FtsI precursor [Raoultella terrigena]|uniref:Peptidoglycan synthase FtsI n=1 Tax=Raoultella terrigena TaxID=577 RepID=A0A485BS18_RAOTE|nr:Peptidoglycan synthase FtsI precursor [Raoultella terrigena]